MPGEDNEALFLLRATARGEQRAFARLYSMTSARTAAYLGRLLRERDAIEDVLAETYVEVWLKAARFDERSQVTTWIIGIARNLALNRLKRRRFHASLDELSEEPVAPDEMEDLDGMRSLVGRALRALPFHHREILGLVLIEELSYEQIASILSIPLPTVKTRVFYARAAMRRQLDAMGIARADVL